MAASNSLTFVALLPLVLVMVRPLSLSLSSDHISQLLKISFLACLLWIDFFFLAPIGETDIMVMLLQ
jgi:hypothetical protein